MMASAIADHPAERLYRTGRCGSVVAGRQIEFGGRVDHQIKLGFVRIEPAEMGIGLERS